VILFAYNGTKYELI